MIFTYGHTSKTRGDLNCHFQSLVVPGWLFLQYYCLPQQKRRKESQLKSRPERKRSFTSLQTIIPAPAAMLVIRLLIPAAKKMVRWSQPGEASSSGTVFARANASRQQMFITHRTPDFVERKKSGSRSARQGTPIPTGEWNTQSCFIRSRLSSQ